MEVINHVRPWLPAVSANSPPRRPAPGTRAGGTWRCPAGPAVTRRRMPNRPGGTRRWRGRGAIMDPGNLYWDMRLSPRHPTVEIACAAWRRRNGRRRRSRCSRRASPPRRSPGSGTGWTRRGCRRRCCGPTCGARRGTAWTGPASTRWTGGARAAAGRGAAAPGRRGE
ncbi:hypothetical protein [Amycolatopsis thermoflava]|uniref:hypothetical protein n=1 Tax=Amycolatopsis thermoflava TaxID=84480 RepID=UPI003F4A3AB2